MRILTCGSKTSGRTVDDFLGVYGEVGVSGKLLQYLGGGDEDGGLLRVESWDVRVQGFEQVVKIKAYQRAFDGGVEVAVGTQEEGDAVAGEVGAGQHTFEHIACPQGGLFGGNEENAPVAAGAGGKPDGDFFARGRLKNGAEVAAFFGFERDGEGIFFADAVGVDVGEMLHEDAFVDNGVVLQLGAVGGRSGCCGLLKGGRAVFAGVLQGRRVPCSFGCGKGFEDLPF